MRGEAKLENVFSAVCATVQQQRGLKHSIAPIGKTSAVVADCGASLVERPPQDRKTFMKSVDLGQFCTREVREPEETTHAFGVISPADRDKIQPPKFLQEVTHSVRIQPCGGSDLGNRMLAVDLLHQRQLRIVELEAPIVS